MCALGSTRGAVQQPGAHGCPPARPASAPEGCQVWDQGITHLLPPPPRSMACAEQGSLSLDAAQYVLSWEFMELETKEPSEDKARFS